MAFDAETYSAGHADPSGMVCPHCAEPMPRTAHYCPSCGWDAIRGIPHQAPPGTTSSSGRQPSSAAYRAEVIAGFADTPGVAVPGGPPLDVQLGDLDGVLAVLEQDHDAADREIREVLGRQFGRAAGENLTETVADAQRIAAARAPTGAAMDAVKELTQAYRAWKSTSDKLSAARKRQGELLDRYRSNGLDPRNW